MTEQYKSFQKQFIECKKHGNCVEVDSEKYHREYPAKIFWCKKLNQQCKGSLCLYFRQRGINPRTRKKEVKNASKQQKENNKT